MLHFVEFVRSANPYSTNPETKGVASMMEWPRVILKLMVRTIFSENSEQGEGRHASELPSFPPVMRNVDFRSEAFSPMPLDFHDVSVVQIAVHEAKNTCGPIIPARV